MRTGLPTLKPVVLGEFGPMLQVRPSTVIELASTALIGPTAAAFGATASRVVRPFGDETAPMKASTPPLQPIRAWPPIAYPLVLGEFTPIVQASVRSPSWTPIVLGSSVTIVPEMLLVDVGRTRLPAGGGAIVENATRMWFGQASRMRSPRRRASVAGDAEVIEQVSWRCRSETETELVESELIVPAAVAVTATRFEASAAALASPSRATGRSRRRRMCPLSALSAPGCNPHE